MSQFRDLMIGLFLGWVLAMGLFDARVIEHCEPRVAKGGGPVDQCKWSLGWVLPKP